MNNIFRIKFIEREVIVSKNKEITEEEIQELLGGKTKLDKDVEAIKEALENFVRNHTGRYYCILSIPDKYGSKIRIVAGSMTDAEAFDKLTFELEREKEDVLIRLLKKRGYEVHKLG